MGAEVCRAVSEADDLELVATIDPGSEEGYASIEELDGASVDVIVDFTVLEASRGVLEWCAANGVHAVVGTTGFTEQDLSTFEQSFTTSNLLIAPNFAIGAIMMMRMAELAAPHFDTAEVVEYHHNTKKDAPSGTAMMTARRVDAAKTASGSHWQGDPTENEVVPNARGGKVGGVGVHGVRMVGMVAHQEVIFGLAGETLTIRHDSLDRKSFMGGVTLAVRSIANRPGITLGLDPLLF